jgi:hypothetical protein
MRLVKISAPQTDSGKRCSLPRPAWAAVARRTSLLILIILVLAAVQAPVAAFAEQIPLIVLSEDSNNFFVLASDIPFSVSRAEAHDRWLAVEALAGKQTPHRTVAVKRRKARLTPQTEYSAVRVDLSTAVDDDHILIPVVLQIGDHAETELARGIPTALLLLQPEDPDVQVDVRLTPAGHYIIDIIDVRAEQTRLQALETMVHQQLSAVPAGRSYDIVLPWMCLESPCGRATSDDIADVAPNLDAVNAVSYERYTMFSGNWGLKSVGNPGPWIVQSGLEAWPMLIGGYEPSASSIRAMWQKRASIAQSMKAAAQSNGYAGYCIDVEGHADTSTKNTFIALVDYLADEMHTVGVKIMVAHGTWSTIAPMADLAATAVDYVATMDPYTPNSKYWSRYFHANYNDIDPERLIWGFTWEHFTKDHQMAQWQYLESQGLNNDVAGAAVWRTPLMPPHYNSLDYYEGLRAFYPVGGDAVISHAPAVIEVTARPGSDAGSDQFEIWNSGDGLLDYSISDDADWLACYPDSGTATEAHEVIGVDFQTATLAPGTYTAVITISAAGATNTPRTITVTLTVTNRPDLWGLLQNGASNSTEVHIVDGVNLNQYLLHTATALHPTNANWDFELGDYDGDGIDDIYAINRHGASNSTEVHILDGGNLNQFLLHKATAQHPTNANWDFGVGDYNGDGIDDIYAIYRDGASNSTEVHVLNGADFNQFLRHAATALHPTSENWDFELGDYNSDGIDDIYAINRHGASNSTEVHILNGADFNQFLLHKATAMHPTDHNWDLEIR